MSSPRDRDDAGDDGRGWQEPAHLGGEPADPPAGPPHAGPPPADGPAAEPTEPTGPAEPAGSTAWQPPGWDLPAVEPDRPRPGSAPVEAVPPGPSPVPAPGAVPPPADPTDQWRELSWRFVDDPRAAVDAAAELVQRAVEQQVGLTVADGDSADTEQLRQVFTRLRDLHGRLTG